jgi:hypothetical protein
MEQAVATGIVAGSVFFLMLFLFAAWVLLIVAHWRMFTKAGEAGWKSIVPFYSDYTLFKLVWNTNAYWIFLILTIVLGLTTAFSGSYAIEGSTVVATGASQNILFDIMSFLASIGYLFLTVILSLKTALAYGKGTVYAVGLVLLPNIFTLILAFGNATYRGPQD